MSTTQTTLETKVDADSTAFVWGPVELKKGSSGEILCGLSDLVKMGVIPLGEAVQITTHLETGTLALSPYRIQVDKEGFHSSLVGQKVRKSRRRVAIPVQHSGREPARRDLQWRGGYNTNLTPDTTVFPFAVARTLFAGRPRIYLLTKEQYQGICEHLGRYPDSSGFDEGFNFIYWSKKICHELWDEEWLAVEINPGTFDRIDIHSIPTSRVSEVLFDSSEAPFDNDW